MTIEHEFSQNDLRDEKIISLALQGLSSRRIATQLGVHRDTVSQVIKSSEGQKAIAEAITSVQQATQIMLPRLFTKSLIALESVLDHSSYRDEKIAAAKAIQSLALNVAKLDLAATKLGVGKIVPTTPDDDNHNTNTSHATATSVAGIL